MGEVAKAMPPELEPLGFEDWYVRGEVGRAKHGRSLRIFGLLGKETDRRENFEQTSGRAGMPARRPAGRRRYSITHGNLYPGLSSQRYTLVWSLLTRALQSAQLR
jgi:hypothetical protein